MDPAFYEDLTGRHYGLPIVLEDRHYALGLEDIARAAYRRIGITVREHVLARANQAPPASELVRELAAYG